MLPARSRGLLATFNDDQVQYSYRRHVAQACLLTCVYKGQVVEVPLRGAFVEVRVHGAGVLRARERSGQPLHSAMHAEALHPNCATCQRVLRTCGALASAATSECVSRTSVMARMFSTMCEALRLQQQGSGSRAACTDVARSTGSTLTCEGSWGCRLPTATRAGPAHIDSATRERGGGGGGWQSCAIVQRAWAGEMPCALATATGRGSDRGVGDRPVPSVG